MLEHRCVQIRFGVFNAADSVHLYNKQENRGKRHSQRHDNVVRLKRTIIAIMIDASNRSIAPFIKKSKIILQKLNTLVFGAENGEKIISLYDDERLDFDFSDNLAQEITDLVFVCPNRALARFACLLGFCKAISGHHSTDLAMYNSAV